MVRTRIDYPPTLTEHRQTCSADDTALLDILAPEKGAYRDLAVKAWQSLHKNWYANPYNAENYSDYGFRFFWVEHELGWIKDAQQLPLYMRLKESEKKEIQKKLKDNTTTLVKALRDLGLDGSLLYCESKMRGNWHIYEDQREKIKVWFDEDGSEKILLSRIIEVAGNRAIEKVQESKHLGKKGRNAEAVAFLRLLIEEHQQRYAYGKPLYGVSATLTNLLYDTDYDESSARRIALG